MVEGAPLSYQPKVAIQKPAPTFSEVAWYKGFKTINLSDYKGKYVILFFWPLDFTFVCPTEIVQFSDRAAEFRDIGCEIIGCSVDSKYTHMEYTRKERKKGGLGPMDIPMVADISKQIAKDYGALLDQGEDNGVALRATFIIDKEGILRHMSYNDLPVGRNVEEILRLVKAFQYTDEYGEVCPAQWKPGDKTMVEDPDADKNKDYWATQHGKE